MAKAKETTVGKLIDNLYEKREQIRKLTKTLQGLETERDELAERLMTAMEAQGIESSRGSSATATISEVIVPQVVDWDRFQNFIIRNKALHLLERRPAVVAYRELLEVRKGRKIPGVDSFTKRSIRLLTKPGKNS